MASNLKCPKCGICELEPQVHDGVNVELCSKCNGVWLHKGELNKIAHPHEGDLEYCSVDHIEEDRISDFYCPSCHDIKLKKVNFISYSEIILEYCTKCEGIWLDRGELDAINAEIDKLQKVPEPWAHRIMVFLAKLPF
ncbi:MAG TPA: hypothetical protein DET40_26020 [Lentisphaeria bacterium]|nr:MAG: hypothetical protein A2X45_12900 [Lentisphaerae bacterium GWF2_50_93]HCE47020.1 hypothetical protein [Lentisphaeria bacterium]